MEEQSLTAIFAPLYAVFGFVFKILIDLVNNYAVAIFLLTLLLRLITLPANVSQQKTMAKTTRLQPKIAKLQKKYATDRVKLNTEMQALYARENHNPMSMGCGPMVFQMVFLLGIIGVIYQPLKYVLMISTADIDNLVTAAKAIVGSGSKMTSGTYAELSVLTNLEAIMKNNPNMVSASTYEAISKFHESFHLFGIDLTQVPQFKQFNELWVVPILSGVTSFGSSIYSWLKQKQNNPTAGNNSMMFIMSFGMPLFSLWFTFQLPAGVGFYWACSNILTMLQMIILNYTHSPKKVAAKLMINETIERRSKEANIKKIKQLGN